MALTTSEDGGEGEEEDDEGHGIEEEEEVDDEPVGVVDHTAQAAFPLNTDLERLEKMFLPYLIDHITFFGRSENPFEHETVKNDT